MIRRVPSKRRSAGPVRKRQLLVESLEDRRLLAFTAPFGGEPSHVFAVAQGTIVAPGGTVTETLDTSGHTYPRALAVLGFEVAGSAGLDPDTVQLSGPGVFNYLVLPDIVGSNNSLLLARVGLGSIDVTVSGQGGTTGDFDVHVFLPGDDNGSHNIELSDLQTFLPRLGSSVGDANYAFEVDSDLDGTITRSDSIPQRLNFGVTVVEPAPTAVPPTAVDDDAAGAPAFLAFSGNTLTVSNGAGDIVERNDIVGSPAAVISSFGGGSLGGSVTDNFAGSTVPNGGGGTLQVNPNGSFTLATAPSQSGLFTFDYRLDNGVGTSDATVTVEIIDATPPTLLITNPTAGQDLPIGITVPFTANASDNVGVVQVEFFVDGVSIFTDTSAPYGTFFTVPASPTPLPISATATDASGNTSTQSFTVDPVDVTPPNISITAPSDGDDVVEGSTVTFSANASDNIAVAEVAFKINGVTIFTDTTAPYTTSFTVPASPTPLPLEAVVMDAAGNSASQSISVDIVAPVEGDFGAGGDGAISAGGQGDGATSITTAKLNRNVDSAIGQLIVSRLTTSQRNTLHEATFALADLSDGTLGRAEFDTNIAGASPPLADRHGHSLRRTNGHMLGQDHGDGVMSETLATSIRANLDAFFASLD